MVCSSYDEHGFSERIDSLLVAYIADMVAASDVQIDLIAVAFGLSETECEKTPDRIRGRAGFEELKRERPLRRWNFIR
ncbi:unnamed protein product, partial [Mesorhabditis belari]|uniref:Uncharacterized protein n=1 Tax=Mesorhabditis belari TaxID=2138241 RepID=A0AAF3J3C3_9BILA